MIADMKSNKKLSPIVNESFQRKKTQHFPSFYITILFQNVQNYKTKRDTLFYHENS